METLYEKKQLLKSVLRDLKSVVVAFSSGVDSTFLLKTAHDVLGDNVIAVTARAVSFPERETKEAAAFCEREHIRHIFLDFDPLSVEGFRQNTKERCLFCKHALFSKIMEIAENYGIPHVAEGTNADDTDDYRPGMIAVAALGIKSPLLSAGLTKEEIRRLSRELGLPTWDKPSCACLASRFVYGEPISEKKLSMAGRAEQKLLDMGFQQVRVRVHGNMARIEILPEEFQKLLTQDRPKEINRYFQELGFTYVTFDLGGYQTGSMNRMLQQEPSFSADI